MALLSIGGQPGSRHEEVAHLAARRLGATLLDAPKLRRLVAEEFGTHPHIPDPAQLDVLALVAAPLAAAAPLVIAVPGAERLRTLFATLFRVQIVAPLPRRVGAVMIEHRLDRPAARQRLRELDRAQRRPGAAPAFDLVLNTATLEPEPATEVIVAAVTALGLRTAGSLSEAASAHLQFQVRLRLAAHGLVPTGKARPTRPAFANPSEETFARLLDFYRIPWEYEPRSFPLAWDPQGRVTEAFTPDFYLPEADLYVELTTMKQSLVTRKNRKVRRLRALYPEINVQVFYQKDFADLFFKHGLVSQEAPA